MFSINGNEWSVELVDFDDDILQRESGEFTVGCTDSDTKKIYISKSIKGSFLKKVLRHELVHAYIISNNIYIPIEDEEKICDLIATYGKQIISLSEWLYESINNAESFLN